MANNNDKWTEQDMPDLSGKVAIVTGSNSGIGYETARALAQHGATTIMGCRNLQKATVAADQIRTTQPSGDVAVMQLDLGDLESVRQFVSQFRDSYDRLDLLINNAGIMMPPYGKTAQGFETQIGVNHLGHFALTGLLLDMLIQTPQSRVVAISSGAHRQGQINFDDLQSEQNYSSVAAYGQSKLANLLFAYELQRKFEAAGNNTLSVAAHPGWTVTNLQQHSRLVRFFNPFLGQHQTMGALPTLYAATAPTVNGGEYFGPSGILEMRGYPKRVPSSDRSHDVETAQRLWRVSEELTGVTYELVQEAQV